MKSFLLPDYKTLSTGEGHTRDNYVTHKVQLKFERQSL